MCSCNGNGNGNGNGSVTPSGRPAAGYRGGMPSRPVRRQLGLFDNPVRVFSLEELAETVRALERGQPGRTADQLSRAVFAELAMSGPGVPPSSSPRLSGWPGRSSHARRSPAHNGRPARAGELYPGRAR
jgi:hypothetical protein